MRKVIGLGLCAVALLAWAIPASAQEPLRMGVGFGVTTVSETGSGGAVTFSQAIAKLGECKVGWVGDASFTTFGEWQTVITGGGARISLPPWGNWTMVGQFQFGALMEHDLGEWDTEWGYAPGLGVVFARPKWKVDLLFQADLGWVENTLAGPRFLFGIEKRFGHK